jgi:phospholipid-binding lipoprotein MlaA
MGPKPLLRLPGRRDREAVKHLSEVRHILSSPMRISGAAALVVASLVAGCATPPENNPEARAAYKEANDPLEPANRYFFEVNDGLDELLFKPIAAWYNLLLPAPVERGVHNVLTNLNSPVIFANDLMQGSLPRAGITFKRFAINSTLGIGGLFDVAARLGLRRHEEDFGQTLAVWGASEGPYLTMPFLGSSTARDLGWLVDSAMDPWSWILPGHLQYLIYTRTGTQAVDLRARNLDSVEQIRKGALDYYATTRSVYRQRRNYQIENLDEGKESLLGSTGLDGAMSP